MKYESQKRQPDQRLELNLQVKDGVFVMRRELCTATVEDGSKVEVSTTGASIVVTISPPGPDSGWRCYMLSAEELIRAVLEREHQ